MRKVIAVAGVGLSLLLGGWLLRGRVRAGDSGLSIGPGGVVSEVRVEAVGPCMVLDTVEVVAVRTIARVASKADEN
uniref:Uncharacterized protein n=1 Tax=candidate division WOR-3 bacterium TaxID=2052148 RepID=A0A7C4CAJ1_UNCW3